mgnify:CR=1 FL=1
MVALGAKVAGVMGNADVVARLRTAGDATNERVWELPLWDDEYGKMIDSDVADMKNIGGRLAGAITGAQFIQRFVNDVPWAHLDIAGPSRAPADSGYTPKGGTGFATRTLIELARSYTPPKRTRG